MVAGVRGLWVPRQAMQEDAHLQYLMYQWLTMNTAVLRGGRV